MSRATVTLLAFLCTHAAWTATVSINEFQASNSETIADEDGDFEDWLELYNYGDAPVLLGGYGLSDDEEDPFRWVLPDISLGAGEFLLVFASNKDRTGGPFLHTNFAISAAGEEVLLTAPDGALLDFVPPTPIPTDVSYGRQPDGTGDWFFFEVPTPGTGNAEEGYLGVLDPPAFSHEGGFYEEAFLLTAGHADQMASIRYTLDGTLPDADSPQWTEPLFIVGRSDEPDGLAAIPTSLEGWWNPPLGPVYKGTPVRIQATRPGWAPSPVVTRTYFVTPETSQRYGLPVVSLVTSPDNFFSPAHGLYVPGESLDESDVMTANFHQLGGDWERPVHIEYIEADGAMAFAQDAGVRIHGGASRIYPQKALRIYARDAYSGTDAFAYPLFPGLERPAGGEWNVFYRFLLRNAGNDLPGAMLRDAFMQSLVLHLERVETQACQPVIVFLNGEYWGLHHVRPRYDQHHFASKYGLDPDRITILANYAGLNQGSEADRDDFIALRHYAVQNDLSIPSHFAHVESIIDTASFLHYFMANIYFHNSDWPHNNIKFWRYQASAEESPADDEWWRDGRWRWMLYDTDFGFWLGAPTRWEHNAEALDAFEELYGTLTGPSANTLRWATTELNAFNLQAWPNELFRALLDNELFRTAFISQFADHLNSSFREEHVLTQLQAARARIAPVMEEHINRWRVIQGMTNWNHHVDIMADFGNRRPTYMRRHIIDYFGLEGTYELRIAMPPAGAGRLRINSIELEAHGGDWTGIYFRGLPLEVEVTPEPGHEFLGWQGDYDGQGHMLALTPDSDLTLSPVVKDDRVRLHEVILPRFMQGESPDNNDRVPYACRLRVEGLLPDATYRYANRVVTADDSPTQNGAGNALYFDAGIGAYFRTTATPDFTEPGTYGEFKTDAAGTFEGWFALEPSGHPRFGEPMLFIRILLNDGMGGESYAHFLTTDSAVSVLAFGEGINAATGVYATSPMTAGNIAVLHGDPDGFGRPLAATLIEVAGFQVDERYAAFYEEFVSGRDGRFGSLLPNDLPGGLVRIEEFERSTAVPLRLFTAPDGLWPGDVNTVNPDGGLGFPLVLNLVPAGSGIPGDINDDGVVNAVDVQLAINAALGMELEPGFNADVDGDGQVNAVDVQLVINAALGNAIAP